MTDKHKQLKDEKLFQDTIQTHVPARRQWLLLGPAPNGPPKLSKRGKSSSCKAL